MAFAVERNPASRIDSSLRHDGRQVLGNAGPLPLRRLRCRIVGSTGMHQAREDFETTAAPPGTGRPRGTCGPFAPSGTAIPRALGMSTARTSGRMSLGNARRPHSLGGRCGLFQCMPIPKPINHRDNSVGKSPREPQGQPLSTRKRPGNPQRTKAKRSCSCTAQAGTLSQSRGGKTAVHRPLRCIRRSGGANLLLREFVIEYVPSHPSAKSHGGGRAGQANRGGRPAGAGDRPARSNQRWRVRSEGTGRPAAISTSCTRIRPAPQVGCSRQPHGGLHRLGGPAGGRG